MPKTNEVDTEEVQKAEFEDGFDDEGRCTEDDPDDSNSECDDGSPRRLGLGDADPPCAVTSSHNR